MAAPEGPIADRVQAYLPVTWDALSQDARYGDGFLQDAIDLAKESIFGSVITETEEEAQTLFVRNYVAKLAAIEIIPGAIDYWLTEHQISITLTGTNETTTYEERASNLRAMRDEFIAETRAAYDDVVAIVGFRRTTGKSRPLIDTLDEDFLTPSPLEFPRPYARTART